MPEIPTPFGTIPDIPICECIPATPEEICIDFPIAGKICSGRTSMAKYEGLGEMTIQFLGTLQPMLAPLMPILVLLSLVLALIDCIKSIPKAITQLSPDPVIECIERLSELLPQLLQFIPPLNYVQLVANIIFFMITLIEAFIELLEDLSDLNLNLELDLLPDNDQYRCCLEANIQSKLDQLSASMRMSGPLFKIIAEILRLLTIPGTEKYVQPLIDAAEFLGGTALTLDTDELSGVISLLRDLQKALEALHNVLAGVLGFVQGLLACDCDISEAGL